MDGFLLAPLRLAQPEPPRPHHVKPRGPSPLFLATGQGNGLGYSTKPRRQLPIVADEPETVDRIRAATRIDDEPECVGPAILDGYAEAADFRRTQQHALDVAAIQPIRATLAAEDRLKDIHRRAKHSHVDLSHELHIMTRDLTQARERGRATPAKTLARIGRIESLLDCLPL